MRTRSASRAASHLVEVVHNRATRPEDGQRRPVRAIVGAPTVDALLGGSRPCMADVCAIAPDVRHRLAECGQRHDARAPVQRRRCHLSVDEMTALLRRTSDCADVDELEARLKATVLCPAPCGVTYADLVRPDCVHGRAYGVDQYALIFAGLFVDPPGTRAQPAHVDVGMADRDAVWNFVLPLDAEDDASHVLAQSMASNPTGSGRAATAREATMWDAGWLHRGLGNPTTRERLGLHLVLAPRWMVSDDADDVDAATLERLRHGTGHDGSLAHEYNAGRPLHDAEGWMASWVARAGRCDVGREAA